MAPGSLVLFRNVALNNTATSGQESTVGEPSVANNGRHIYMTGNWYASKSLDNAASWDYVSPYVTLPSAAAGFCCDQLTIYDPSRDLFFWLLQYVKDANGDNVFRIAVKRGASLQNNSWYWWDFAPKGLQSAWAGTWFDYPDLALSDNHLWATFNVFNKSGQWQRAVVFKWPLDTLASGGSLGYSWWSTTNNGSLRLTQGARKSMYFVSHVSTTKVRLFHWPDGSGGVTQWDIGVNAWTRGNYSSPGPDGKDWLPRCDGRITGAWTSNGEIGAMWTAGSRASRPHPYVRMLRINETSKAVLEQRDIWNGSTAFAYPAASPNDRGDVGMTMFYGGGNNHPTHCVGVRDAYSTLSLAGTVPAAAGRTTSGVTTCRYGRMNRTVSPGLRPATRCRAHRVSSRGTCTSVATETVAR